MLLLMGMNQWIANIWNSNNTMEKMVKTWIEFRTSAGSVRFYTLHCINFTNSTFLD